MERDLTKLKNKGPSEPKFTNKGPQITKNMEQSSLQAATFVDLNHSL